jgi:hypothetical protein
MRIRIMGCFLCLLLCLAVDVSPQIPLKNVSGRDIAVLCSADGQHYGD